MLEARARHRSVLLDDGRVLIAGGFAGNFLRSLTAEVYCPDTMSPPPTVAQCANGVGTFSPVGSLHAGSDGHTLTKLLDGRVLKVGGRNTKVEIFDPATNSWTDVATAVLPVARTFHQATLLTCTGPGCTYNGKVLITGGDDNTAAGNGIQNTLATTLIFDPATNSLSDGRR
jgi:alpha-tubulin suppressor-like RCC1 family protein